MKERLGALIWPVVHDERQALIDDLASLEPAAWRANSLCLRWDVHDVVAHLIDSAETTRLGFIQRMLAAGFNFDRDNAVGVTREKTAEPLETLAKFQAVRLRTSTPPAALATRLVEAFVHGEDIRRPLKIIRDYPPEHVATALGYQVKTSVKIGGGKEIAQGWRLVATDTGFEHGDGPEVHALAITLLLAASGRPVAANELTGPGAAAFHAATIKEPA
ncbi:maleylpyruvate isomerase family mycothiol-dependent enzyme [Paeniglutamicibacter antarcticus]|uniref:Maleylpyruvate isomerase family mycothiol-dependent enzyme n=1 Tax=Arthrobacter terrae TaxID=2935737 RepID=A0A931G9V8_9MICC|nr:maleylpyruvate isomerase family mycothiol-dependent enzyme [Arthrobacter terrae]MBG0741494.1 maleylpyruvate isomerase family mycothiol-dependent enzyme [Arthrobacter terrae]